MKKQRYKQKREKKFKNFFQTTELKKSKIWRDRHIREKKYKILENIVRKREEKGERKKKEMGCSPETEK